MWGKNRKPFTGASKRSDDCMLTSMNMYNSKNEFKNVPNFIKRQEKLLNFFEKKVRCQKIKLKFELTKYMAIEGTIYSSHLLYGQGSIACTYTEQSIIAAILKNSQKNGKVCKHKFDGKFILKTSNYMLDHSGISHCYYGEIKYDSILLYDNDKCIGYDTTLFNNPEMDKHVGWD